MPSGPRFNLSVTQLMIAVALIGVGFGIMAPPLAVIYAAVLTNMLVWTSWRRPPLTPEQWGNLHVCHVFWVVVGLLSSWPTW